MQGSRQVWPVDNRTYVDHARQMHPHEGQLLLCASCVGIADKLLQSQGSWIAQSQQGTNVKQKQTWAAGKMWDGKGGDRKEIIRERREEEGCSNRKSSSRQDGAGSRAENRRPSNYA